MRHSMVLPQQEHEVLLAWVCISQAQDSAHMPGVSCVALLHSKCFVRCCRSVNEACCNCLYHAQMTMCAASSCGSCCAHLTCHCLAALQSPQLRSSLTGS